MGRAPCCEKIGLKRGRWTAEEDEKLSTYIQAHGEGSWRSLPKNAGLLRCGKSCRLRWINYLRSDLKRGNISVEEEDTIVRLQASLGNRWSLIASHFAGRTDNEIKNYWNSHLSRKITPSNSSKPTRRQSSDTKTKKPRKRTSTPSPDKQSNMINPSTTRNVEAMHESSTSGWEKENELDDCFNEENILLMDPTWLLDQEDVNIDNMNSASSSTNDGSDHQVNLEVDWGWEWDFDGGEVGLVDEEEDDIMSWPWESQTTSVEEELAIGVDLEKQNAMIAWLLS